MKTISRADIPEDFSYYRSRYGIDIASVEFYQSGLREVEKMVEKFEKLI